MMNGSEIRKRVKGFTLVEMIVVIAIIGVLLGVLAPSMWTYYHKSRVRAANADAKMVYNAAQTEIMRYMSMDRNRTYENSSHLGMNGNNSTTGKFWITYNPQSGGQYKLNGSGAFSSVTGDQGSVDANAAAKTASEIVSRVNRMVSGAESVCWAIYVDNYIVKSSVSAQNGTTNCIGFYSANKQQAEEYSDETYNTSYMWVLNRYAAKYDGTEFDTKNTESGSGQTQ